MRAAGLAGARKAKVFRAAAPADGFNLAVFADEPANLSAGGRPAAMAAAAVAGARWARQHEYHGECRDHIRAETTSHAVPLKQQSVEWFNYSRLRISRRFDFATVRFPRITS
jgi:hypothetical protein